MLIAGDQVLPRITPNVSVQAQEPESDPLTLFMASLDKLRDLPADTLVLPSHDWPFRNLHGRLDSMAEHHEERLEATLAACAEPATAIDVLGHLFTRKLDNHQIFFAVGETLAHIHRLMHQGRIRRDLAPDGAYRYTAV